MSIGGSPRAFGAGPLAWPSPSGPLGGRGLQGQRRAAGASRAAGCEAPLRLEGPTQTMRGVPVPVGCDIVPAIGALGVRVTVWPSCWGARQRIRRGPQAAGHGGVPCAAAAAPKGLRPKDAAKAAAPRRRDPRVNPGRLWRVTLAALSLSAVRACPRCSRPGPSGPACRRCALEAV